MVENGKRGQPIPRWAPRRGCYAGPMATVSCRECGALIINEASNVPFDQRGECPVMDMHRYSGETERLAQAVMRIALDRLRMDAPLDGPRSAADLTARAGQTITAQGLGGCFVQGGTVGNLSALVAARHAALERRGGERPARWSVAITDETHSSVVYALNNVMDVDTLVVPADERGRMTGSALEASLA